jgi:hypothetical protein
MHQICMSRIDNDNIRQSSKTIYGDDNIHLSLCVVGGKGEKPLSVCEF